MEAKVETGAMFSSYILQSHHDSRERPKKERVISPLSAAQDVLSWCRNHRPPPSPLAIAIFHRASIEVEDSYRENSCARTRTKRNESRYLRERGRPPGSPSTRQAQRQHVTLVTHTGQLLCPRAHTRSLSYQRVFTNVGRLIGGRI